jgi:two-component system, response regulator YesN
MYNVMLVDDDYPVIELLSEVIPWEEMGLQLVGAHENGLTAWEQAKEEMPDIVITDIGMPKMNGLELIRHLKEKKANIRIAILSCHSEFHYAQQAVRLNVQEYLIKDTLNPADLEKLLIQFKISLDEEARMNLHQSQLKHIVDGSKQLRKEQWLKNFIHQPMLSPEEWLKEANAYRLFLEGEACLPIIGFIEGYQQAKQRFLSDETLRFAVNNVVNEVLHSLELQGFHISHGVKDFFLIFTYKPGIKKNIFDQAVLCLKEIQYALQKVLKLHISFILGESAGSPIELKLGLNYLLESFPQRFYLGENDIVKRSPPHKPSNNLFTLYDQASKELREVLTRKQTDAVQGSVRQWITVIKEQAYTPEMVKDWVLKLLLDLRLKLQSLQFIRSGYNADTLHLEIRDIDSLTQMEVWLIDHLQSLTTLADTGTGLSVRTEMIEACQYVSLRLDKRITLEEVAEHLHLNPSYFSRLFKKETGETFIEYVTRMKIERAKELLDQTGQSVGKICELLGYDNQSYFIKIFKVHTGVTPVEYRG